MCWVDWQCTSGSPGRAHAQHLVEAQGNQSVQQEAGGTLGEQILRIALLVVQGTQQPAGAPQLGDGHRDAYVGGVCTRLLGKQEELAVLTKLLFVRWEGDKLLEPARGDASSHFTAIWHQMKTFDVYLTSTLTLHCTVAG